MKRTLSILMLLALTACARAFNGAEDSIAVEDRYPITVNPDTATLEVVVLPGQRSLDATDATSIGSFISEYKMRGHSLMQVSLPRGSRNASSAERVYKQVRGEFSKRGLSDAYVETTAYQASPDEDSAPIIMTFTRYVAETTKCGNWSDSMAWSPDNKPWANFGCATQNNLAAMMEDPHDLVAPRGMSPSDPERRTIVFDKYRNGEVTASQRATDEKAKASNVGN